MFDITNYSSLAHIGDWLQSARKKLTLGTPITIVGNKADLFEQHEVTRKEAIEIAKLRGANEYIECSSKTGVNI